MVSATPVASLQYAWPAPSPPVPPVVLVGIGAGPAAGGTTRRNGETEATGPRTCSGGAVGGLGATWGAAAGATGLPGAVAEGAATAGGAAARNLAGPGCQPQTIHAAITGTATRTFTARLLISDFTGLGAGSDYSGHIVVALGVIDPTTGTLGITGRRRYERYDRYKRQNRQALPRWTERGGRRWEPGKMAASLRAVFAPRLALDAGKVSRPGVACLAGRVQDPKTLVGQQGAGRDRRGIGLHLLPSGGLAWPRGGFKRRQARFSTGAR